MSTVLCAYLCGLSAQSLAMSVPTRRLMEANGGYDSDGYCGYIF